MPTFLPNLRLMRPPVVLEKKMITHDERLTTDDNGRQPIAIGHLNDSGDLTRYKSEQMTYNPLRLLQSPLLRAGARA